jgi:flagellar basal body-associated protein FliL
MGEGPKETAGLLSGKSRDQAVEMNLMNEVLEPGAKEGPVKEVLFTSFIIQ